MILVCSFGCKIKKRNIYYYLPCKKIFNPLSNIYIKKYKELPKLLVPHHIAYKHTFNQ